MTRLIVLAIITLFAVSACTPTNPGGDGAGTGTKVYRIKASDKAKVQFRALDSINALRAAAGAPKLEFDSKLNAAAATHARDMSVQNRPWHFGSDGSSPLDRVARVGYDGKLIGENISETYEDEAQTVAAWMKQPDTRDVILSPAARKLGFSWYQESNGKIWWTMVTGS